MKLEVGNYNITRHANHYPFLAYITDTLEKSNSDKKGRLLTQLYAEDDGDNLSTTNVGYFHRKAISQNSKKITVFGNLCHGFLNESGKYLIPQVPIRISLKRSSNEFCIDSEALSTGEKFDATFTLQSCHLLVKRFEVSEQVRAIHEHILTKGIPFNYFFTDRSEISYSVKEGALEHLSPALSTGRLPNRVYTAMISSTAFYGDEFKAFHKFEPFLLKNAACQ